MITQRDAFYQLPTVETVRALARRIGVDDETAARQLVQGREKLLNEAAADPFRHGFEPPIWIVARALLKGCRISHAQADAIERRFGMDWEAFRLALCKRLGFERPVSELLIMGANRSGKTDFASKLSLETALIDPCFVTIGSQIIATSKATQQARVWHYLPAEMKKTVKSKGEYISYTQNNGFSHNKITLVNGSQTQFVSYDQDVTKIMEGPAFKLLWLDEEFPKTFLDAGRLRVASTRGNLLMTFTPVSGFTPVVADFLENSVVTRYALSYMLPRDGKEPAPWLALGLSREEYTALLAYHDDSAKGVCRVPESRPEDCLAWLNDRENCDSCLLPGRAFERVPRVAVAKGGEAAVIWFHGRDNPYGMPQEVIKAAMKNRNATDEIRKRVCGLAKKLKGKRFPHFNPALHVIAPDKIPEGGVCSFVVDPAPERNWFFIWAKVIEGSVYIYREWPGAYEIPEVGVPGPWAKLSDRNSGVNDGDRGEGSEKFGFSLLRYKFEWARLEGWHDYEEWVKAEGDYEAIPPDDLLETWSDSNGSRERMRRRILDSRAGSQSKISATEDKTLFDLCDEMADGFEPASGKAIGSGEEQINTLLYTRDGSPPRLFISRDCHNVIFALTHYTGRDGQKGACKESIDCLRYLLQSGCLEDQPDERFDNRFSPRSAFPLPRSGYRMGAGGRKIWR